MIHNLNKKAMQRDFSHREMQRKEYNIACISEDMALDEALELKYSQENLQYNYMRNIFLSLLQGNVSIFIVKAKYNIWIE